MNTENQAILSDLLKIHGLQAIADTKPQAYTDGDNFYQLRKFAINKGKKFCGWCKVKVPNPAIKDKQAMLQSLIELYDVDELMKLATDSKAIAIQAKHRKAIETRLSGGKMTDADYTRIWNGMDSDLLSEYTGNKDKLDAYIQSVYDAEIAENGTDVAIDIY